MGGSLKDQGVKGVNFNAELATLLALEHLTYKKVRVIVRMHGEAS